MLGIKTRNIVLLLIAILLLLACAALILIVFSSLIFQPFVATNKYVPYSRYSSRVHLIQEIFDQQSDDIEQISVHFLDVGNADCIFIDAGDIDILIDGGYYDDGQYIVEYLKELNTDSIELMIATHPHLDHVGGLTQVLEAFKVEAIIDSGISSTFKIYQDYLNAAKKEWAVFLEDEDMKFELAPEITFRIIETGDNYFDINNNSVVSLLTFKDIKFLFTGDMGRMAEVRNLNKFPEVDILKVAHHGSRSSSCPAFLNRVNPKVAVMSCGICDICGKNHGQNIATLKELDKRNIPVYRTDLSGNIIVTTDGSAFWIEIRPRNRQ